jgi:hypothetical protein
MRQSERVLPRTSRRHGDLDPPHADPNQRAKLQHPDAPPDNNGSERELRPTATYRKVTGGFRSKWGAGLFAGVRSVVGAAARRGLDAYQAIRVVLSGDSVVQPG